MYFRAVYGYYSYKTRDSGGRAKEKEKVPESRQHFATSGYIMWLEVMGKALLFRRKKK